MLRLADVSIAIDGKPIIDRLCLEVAENEIVCLIGAPGSGKSTVLNGVFGLRAVAAGRIEFNGESIVNLTPQQCLAKKVVLVPQGGRVFRSLTVEDNLLLAGYSVQDSLLNDRIDAIYQFFPKLTERRKQVAGSLSGGERQMLALGMGLMVGPRLLLLDEPSTGLAPIPTNKILSEVRRLASELDCTIIVVEQNVKNALMVADRVVVLRRGRISFEQRVAGMTDTQALLDAYSFKGAVESGEGEQS